MPAADAAGVTLTSRFARGGDRDGGDCILQEDSRQGVIKPATTAHDARTGGLIRSLQPVAGFANKNDWTLLLFFSWVRTS